MSAALSLRHWSRAALIVLPLTLGLVACAQTSPTPTAQPQVGAGAQSQDAPPQAGLATAPLTTLNPEAFSFASLTWSSTFEDFQAVFGAPSSDDPVNPRVRYSCFDAKIGLDPVSVCVQLSSGVAFYVYVVAQVKYTGRELQSAFEDWRKLVEARLGQGAPVSPHDEGLALDWYLADGTKLRLHTQGAVLRLDFWQK